MRDPPNNSHNQTPVEKLGATLQMHLNDPCIIGGGGSLLIQMHQCLSKLDIA